MYTCANGCMSVKRRRIAAMVFNRPINHGADSSRTMDIATILSHSLIVSNNEIARHLF